VEALLFLAFVSSFSPFETHATNYHTHRVTSLEPPHQQLKKPLSLQEELPPSLPSSLLLLPFTLVI